MESHPIYFQANRRWLMSWNKASSLFLLSPLLLSSAVPLVIPRTEPITSERIQSCAHTFTFVCPISYIYIGLKKKKKGNHTSNTHTCGINGHAAVTHTYTQTHAHSPTRNGQNLWAVGLVCQSLKVCGGVKGLVFKNAVWSRWSHYQKNVPDIISMRDS